MEELTKLEKENPISEYIPNVMLVLQGMLFIGFILVFLVIFILPEKNFNYIGAMSNSLLIAGSFFGAGGLMGFLFGIPKVVQNTTLLPDDERKSLIIHNDNLVQISDWLTKIIVGVGLTQLYEIPGFVKRIGEHFGKSLLGYDAGLFGTNASIAIVLYFLIIGFLIFYIWTRNIYTTILKQSDDGLQREQKYKKAVKESIIQKEQKEIAIIEKNKEKEAKEDLKRDMEAIINTFPINALQTDKIDATNNPLIDDDPQKGKWGGLSINNEREIKAVVTEAKSIADFFNVHLEVVSTNYQNPLKGEVIFHMHPTIPNPDRIIPVENGTAQLDLITYGSFTVGVECDNRKTQLELDLSQLPDVPAIFKER